MITLANLLRVSTTSVKPIARVARLSVPSGSIHRHRNSSIYSVHAISRPFSSTRPSFARKKKKEIGGDTGLNATLEQIQGLYGVGSLQRLGSVGASVAPGDKGTQIESVSTGSLGLDLALGIGGLPKRRIVEIFGPESSGKTTLALSVIAEAQKKGGTCCFIDVEHALDPSWAKKLGVNVDELLFSQPDSAEEALEIADTLVASGHVSVLVIDSVAALVPKSELEGNMGDAQVGVQARLMSHALRKLTASIAKANTLVIFINQIRMKIGVLFGNPETTSGGNALKFYASVRLDVRRIGQIKVGDDIIGNQIRVKVAKNKVAPPYKQAEFDILFGQGFSKAGEVLDIGVREGLIVKSGAFYTLPPGKDDLSPTKLGQGREKARAYLEEHVDVADKVEAAIRDKVLARTARAVDISSNDAETEEHEEEGDVEIVAEEAQPKESDSI